MRNTIVVGLVFLTFILTFILGFATASFFLTSGKNLTSVFSDMSLCRPNYIFGSLWVGDDHCKEICFASYKSTSYEKNQSADLKIDVCYCDINNCNPK